MTKSDVIAELPRFSSCERREILERLLELEDEASTLEARRRLADEAFLMLDAVEEQHAKDPAR
jgi:hypothetical protein